MWVAAMMVVVAMIIVRVVVVCIGSVRIIVMMLYRFRPRAVERHVNQAP